MGKKLSEIYKNNKLIAWAAAVALVLAAGVLVIVKDEVTRFTLIMPLFAGFILFSILVTPDEELEDGPVDDEDDEEKKEETPKKAKARKKSR